MKTKPDTKPDTKTPAERREEMEKQVDAAHDWLKGKVYAAGDWTDTCQICFLRRHYASATQNGAPGHYEYEVAGNAISLRQAVERGC